LYLDQN